MERNQALPLSDHCDGVDWRARAVAHAQALVSMLAARPVTGGTFGEAWLAEARETCRLDFNTEPFFAGGGALRTDGSLAPNEDQDVPNRNHPARVARVACLDPASALNEFRAGLTAALDAHGVPAMPSWREAIDWLAANGGRGRAASDEKEGGR